MFGPASVLDGGGSQHETVAVQRLLQRVSESRIAEGPDSNWDAGIKAQHQLQILSLAEPLLWSIPNINRCLSTNSP